MRMQRLIPFGIATIALGCAAMVHVAWAAQNKLVLPEKQAWEVVRGNCSPCHSMRLVTQQRLDRNNWEWVMEDMIKKFGATWISPELRAIIVDYLVQHYGPKK